MTRDIVEDTARRLIAAERQRQPIPPIRESLPDIGEAEAYAIQSAVLDAATAVGRRVVGRKIGLTNPAVQRQLGVDRPDFGAVLSDRSFGDGETIPSEYFLQPKAEAEVSFLLERDVSIPAPGWADLVAAIGWVLPSVEIVDSRIANWDIRFIDTVADNASFGACVLGGPARRLDGLDLKTCGMVLEVNGEQCSTGIGAACLGHPLNAAVWLARKLSELGTPLRAGDIIMTGALGPMVSIGPGDCVEARIDGLGSVSLRLSEEKE